MGKNNNNEMLSYIITAERTYDPDPAHSEQVRGLVLALFDGLKVLHGYGPQERLLLEIAGRLHDIGWSQGGSGKHHKLSSKLILKLDIPGLTAQERIICALIARYHTKALPDATRHKPFASLDVDGRALVEWLAGILRVADGLDCNHAHNIRGLTCTVNGKVVKIYLQTVVGNCRREIERAMEKQTLLIKKMGRMIEYQC